MWQREKKPVVGVFGFSGCAGDQLAIIHMEDELIDFFTSAEIRFYHMAQSHQEVDFVDIALVEGSINTSKQEAELKEIREKANVVVALGTCAAYGGIQYLGDDDSEFKERLKYVYGKDGKDPEFLNMIGEPQGAQPISDFIRVDFTVPGCPVAKENLIPIYTKLICDLKPVKYPYAVCLECKYQGNYCFLLHDKFCLGPITSAGCNARCPSLNISCVGCFGPFEAANYKSMIDKLKEIGLSEEEINRKIMMFGGNTAKEDLGGLKKSKA